MFRIITLCSVYFLFILGVSLGADIYVPNDYPTIQDAISAAVDGDTVIVMPGTYVENIDFMGKAIHVKSETGAAATVIDGNQAGSVATCQSGEGQDSVLDGFTLTNGTGTYISWGYFGGGINCSSSSSPTITCNIISENSVDGHGGGIFCYSSSPTITNNGITGNAATRHGGGIYCIEISSPTISTNTISGNTAGNNGGGISCDPTSSPAITNNTISGNMAGPYGSGGGIRCNSSSPTITNNTISGNMAYEGGGIECYYSSSPIISNNTISGNNAEWNGGGVHCYYYSSPIFSNNTFSGNTAINYGGGISCNWHSSPIVTNIILWDNNASTGKEIGVGQASRPSTLTISYSDVDGDQSSCYVDPGSTLNWGSGMIDADPLFVDSPAGDFHLTWNSPCRNAGDNAAAAEPFDFEGDPRTVLGTVDMGADEFHYHLYHFGDVVPGGTISIRVIAPPADPVMVALGSGIQDPPLSTLYGDLYLQFPILRTITLGATPPEGVQTFDATVPSFWIQGEEKPLQALVGPLGNASSVLTNLQVLSVE